MKARCLSSRQGSLRLLPVSCLTLCAFDRRQDGEQGRRTGLRTGHTQPLTQSLSPQPTRLLEAFHDLPTCSFRLPLSQSSIPIPSLNELPPFGSALRLTLPFMKLLFTCSQPAGRISGRLARHVQCVTDVGEMLQEFAGRYGEI